MKTIKGRPLAAFEGIPYGEDTGRPNRFMVISEIEIFFQFCLSAEPMVTNLISSRLYGSGVGLEFDQRRL